MTKLNQTRSLKQEWSSVNFRTENIEGEIDIKSNRQKTFEALYDEMSTWSLDEDSYTERGITGRLSSLTSWGDDDFEKQSTLQVAELFAKIDYALYESVPFENEKLQQECLDWAERFPYIRITGSQILPSKINLQRYSRPPSVTLALSDSRRRRRQDININEMEDYEEVFAQHSSDSQLENKSMTSQQSLLLPEMPISPSSSFREQASDSLFDILWPELIYGLVQFVQNYSNNRSLNKRRNSDPDMSKRQSVVIFDEEDLRSIDDKKLSLKPITLPNALNQNHLKRAKSPHYMLPTVSSSTLQKTNLMSTNSKSRVISAAVHRTPRRLMPINIDHQPPNSNLKSNSNEQYYKPITARLPPIDMNVQFPNVPSKLPHHQQRAISSYSTRSLKSTLLPMSRAHTNDALFEEDDQDSLQSTLVISPLEFGKNSETEEWQNIQVKKQPKSNENKNKKSYPL